MEKTSVAKDSAAQFRDENDVENREVMADIIY